MQPQNYMSVLLQFSLEIANMGTKAGRLAESEGIEAIIAETEVNFKDIESLSLREPANFHSRLLKDLAHNILN